MTSTTQTTSDGAPTMTTRTHTTEPGDSAGVTLHLWTVGSGAAITLSAVHCDPAVYLGQTPHYASPAADGGHWVFGVIGSHRPVEEPVFGCGLHDGCEGDSIVSRLARPAWARITAAGVTDDAVYAELETIHTSVFAGQVA